MPTWEKAIFCFGGPRKPRNWPSEHWTIDSWKHFYPFPMLEKFTRLRDMLPFFRLQLGHHLGIFGDQQWRRQLHGWITRLPTETTPKKGRIQTDTHRVILADTTATNPYRYKVGGHTPEINQGHSTWKKKRVLWCSANNFMGDHHLSIGSLSTFTVLLSLREHPWIFVLPRGSAVVVRVLQHLAWSPGQILEMKIALQSLRKNPWVWKNSSQEFPWKNSTHSTNFQLPTPSPIVASLLVASCPIVPPSSTFPRSSTWDPRFPNHWRSWQQLCSLPNGEPERKDRQKNRLFCKGPKKIWHTNPKSIALL